MTHPAQIDLRCRDPPRKFLNLRTGVRLSNFACECFHFVG